MSSTVLDRPPAPMQETPLRDAPVLDPSSPFQRGVRLRPSEALRRGAQHHPQGRGVLYYDGTTCALGAMLVGLLGPERVEGMGGMDLEETYGTVIYAHTGVRLDQQVTMPLNVKHPAFGLGWRHFARWVHLKTVKSTLGQAVLYLNDTAGWSREQIADWLESLGF